jgi:flavin reductase (DIM6/NTAB) family NADH-FMN oxidoreductase RutF
MMLAFAPANDAEGNEKDTLRNAKPTWEGGRGVFTISLAVEPIIRQVVAASEPLPYGESEFELAGLSPVAGDAVAAPRVGESPIAFECETFQVIRFARGVPDGGNLVIGRVLVIHLADELRHPRMHVDPALLKAVGRLGGAGYARTSDRFELPRGRAALTRSDAGTRA